MKVLLVYPELPDSFWSAPHVTRFTTTKALTVPLGPLTVAALLPNSWEVKFVDLNVRPIHKKEWLWADIVMISGMIVQRNSFVSLIAEAKEYAKLVVAGGPYPTLMPEELLAAGCDFVVRGEAENTIDLLVEVIGSGTTGKIIACQEPPDLSKSPVPRFDLIRFADYRQFMVQTTRGCPFSCEFCDIAALYGETPRFKSPAQVISELEYLFQLGAKGTVVIADDNFIANAANAKAICRELIEWNRSRGQPFGFNTQVSVNLGQDLEMIDLMTAANFGDVFIGIESPDEDILTANRKYQNVTHPLIDSIDCIKKNGLGVMGSFIIGFDNEKKGAGKRICDFVEITHIPIVMPNVLFAPPGTRLRERLEKEGRCLGEDANKSSCDSVASLPNFIPTRPVEEVMEEYVGIWEHLYDPPRFFERAYKYCLAIRPTRKAMAEKSGKKLPAPLVKASRFPLKARLNDGILFLHHVLTHGVIAPYRRQFWSQLYGMYTQNPSRIRKYIIFCISCHMHVQRSKTIRHEISRQLEAFRAQ